MINIHVTYNTDKHRARTPMDPNGPVQRLDGISIHHFITFND
jgi:hypothetical protein